MTRSANIIRALKTKLKHSSMTYKNLAEALKLSESAVKQMFASENFSLHRLDEICDALGMDLAELVDMASRQETRIEALSLELEKELVKDLKLLLIAYCLVNHWRVEEILEKFAIKPDEIVRMLVKLDKMKLIELLPNNRVRLLIANNFKFSPNGPIEKFFRTQVQGEFFSSNFNSDGALRLIKNGDITRRAQKQLTERIEAVGNLFDDISREQRKEPLGKRQGTTMILAIRNWEFTAFAKLQRDNQEPV